VFELKLLKISLFINKWHSKARFSLIKNQKKCLTSWPAAPMEPTPTLSKKNGGLVGLGEQSKPNPS